MREKERVLQSRIDEMENNAVASGTPKYGSKKTLPTTATPSS